MLQKSRYLKTNRFVFSLSLYVLNIDTRNITIIAICFESCNQMTRVLEMMLMYSFNIYQTMGMID